MKIFLASAELDQVTWAAGSGLADGVLTTPQSLHAAGAVTDPRGLLQDLCRVVAGPVVASVESMGAEEMYRDGRELARLSDQVVVEVPVVDDGMATIRRLSTDGVRVAASLVFSPAQALLAAKAGASTVCCVLQQLEADGHHAMRVVEEMRSVLDSAAVEGDVLATDATNASEFASCVRAGADCVAVSYDVLRSLLVHPLTDRGLDRWLLSLSRLPKGRLTNG
jgi:transaldolase